MSICNLDHFAESYWQDKKFVLVGGCFDPLHEGHLAYFAEARRLGTLVCAVAPDSTITKRTPCLPEMTRLKILNACSLIEHVTLNKASDVIRALKPSHYVVGCDWRVLPVEDRDACAEVGTTIVWLPEQFRENSSTALLADYERRRNVEKLAAFERFVQAQKPADKPWEPVTDYSFEARRNIEGPHAELIHRAFKCHRILDVGCGPDRVLVRMLRGAPFHHDAAGMDISLDVEQDDRLFRRDISEPGLDTYEFGFRDLVICREVLEHLTVRQLAIAVRNLVRLSSKYVYVTTRFTTKPHLLDVDGSDDLDPTHISLLNQDFLRSLFVLEGCTRRPDLEETLDWMKKGRVLVYEVPRD